MTTVTQNSTDLAAKAKTTMIVEMAIDFATMTRVFEQGSTGRIAERLEQFLRLLNQATDPDSYERIHADFCNWFTHNIRTAEKKLKNGRIKPVGSCSYGHAAKVLDIANKVFVYYCGLPSPEQSRQLLPILHGAIDNQILEHLKRKFPGAGIDATSIADMHRADYERLQSLITREISEDFDSAICPVQYDDIFFLRLNRENL